VVSAVDVSSPELLDCLDFELVSKRETATRIAEREGTRKLALNIHCGTAYYLYPCKNTKNYQTICSERAPVQKRTKLGIWEWKNAQQRYSSGCWLTTLKLSAKGQAIQNRTVAMQKRGLAKTCAETRDHLGLARVLPA
jgi:hypothetical protein